MIIDWRVIKDFLCAQLATEKSWLFIPLQLKTIRHANNRQFLQCYSIWQGKGGIYNTSPRYIQIPEFFKYTVLV